MSKFARRLLRGLSKQPVAACIACVVAQARAEPVWLGSMDEFDLFPTAERAGPPEGTSMAPSTARLLSAFASPGLPELEREDSASPLDIPPTTAAASASPSEGLLAASHRQSTFEYAEQVLKELDERFVVPGHDQPAVQGLQLSETEGLPVQPKRQGNAHEPLAQLERSSEAAGESSQPHTPSSFTDPVRASGGSATADSRGLEPAPRDSPPAARASKLPRRLAEPRPKRPFITGGTGTKAHSLPRRPDVSFLVRKAPPAAQPAAQRQRKAGAGSSAPRPKRSSPQKRLQAALRQGLAKDVRRGTHASKTPSGRALSPAVRESVPVPTSPPRGPRGRAVPANPLPQHQGTTVLDKPACQPDAPFTTTHPAQAQEGAGVPSAAATYVSAGAAPVAGTSPVAERRIDLAPAARGVARHVQRVRRQHTQLQRDARHTMGVLAGMLSRVAGAINPSVASLAHVAKQRSQEVAALQSEVTSLRAAASSSAGAAASAKAVSAEAARRLRAAEGAASAQQEAARRMRDWLCDVRGTIRVLCRIRPALEDEAGATAGSAVRVGDVTPDGSRTVVSLAAPRPSYEEVLGRKGLYKGAQKGTSGTRQLAFDRVFDEGSRQEEVFDELRGAVQAAVPGPPAAFTSAGAAGLDVPSLAPKRLAVFAWGATGSGKSHTLWGGAGADAGIVPRALYQVFEMLWRRCGRVLRGGDADASPDTSYDADAGAPFSPAWVNNTYLSGVRCKVAVWEVAHERVVDLSGTQAAPGKEKAGTAAQNTAVPPCVQCTAVGSVAEALQVLGASVARRHTAATRCNATSSRSHLCIALVLQGVSLPGADGTTPPVHDGLVLFCDLAGAERALQAGTARDSKRLAEAGAVSKGLTALGKVLHGMASASSALRSGGRRVLPFRDSALTRCLRPVLGMPGTRVVMLATVAQAAAHAEANARTLRFAAGIGDAVVLR